MIEAGSTHPGAPEAESALGGKHCFCGCGRSIKGLRAHARNALGRRMSLDLAMFRIALNEGIVTEGAADLEAFVAEGPLHIERLRANVHGELSRREMNKKEVVSWPKRSLTPNSNPSGNASSTPESRWIVRIVRVLGSSCVGRTSAPADRVD